MTQDEIFLQSEGDCWMARNKAAISDPETQANDPVIATIGMMKLAPQSVLEIGASNGWRLQEIARRQGCRVTAVEPSSQAIQDGQAQFPNVRFLRGTASALPFDEIAQFDLVILSFVLHWVDRSTLLRSVAEIDRVLADGGFLLIGDFYPALPQRVPYHHLPNQDVWTYKQNYADVFLASNLYELAAFYSFDHADHANHALRADVPPRDRGQVALLRKRLTDRYQNASSAAPNP
jgi:SAM-dependent methyltransferase